MPSTFLSRCLLCILLLVFSQHASAQRKLTLAEAIQFSIDHSLQMQINRNNYGIVEQTYLSQRASLFPQINLSANLPGYTRSITSVTQPDGTVKFTGVEQALSNMGLSLNQVIPATGGTFTVSSNLNRFDRLSGVQYSTYNSQPVLLSLNQPIFSFNQVDFNIRTSRLNRILGSKTYAQTTQDISMQVAQAYYRMLQAQVNMELSAFNLQKTDTLLKLAQTRLKLGNIGEEEFIMITLERTRLLNQNNQAGLAYSNAKNDLCILVNLNPADELVLDLSSPAPSSSQPVNLTPLSGDDIAVLIREGKKNNPDFEEQRLNQVQSEGALKRAKYNLRPNVVLKASYGTNQSALELNDAYRNPLSQQNITMGVNIPLYSAGANKAKYKISQLQLDNQEAQEQLVEQQFTNKLLSQVKQYNISIESINNVMLTDSLSQRWYSISFNKYKAGKLTYTDLLNAQYQRDQSGMNLVDAVAAYWSAYYQLRMSTLYDFEKKESLYQEGKNP